jgi:cytochrome bd-type quinol oxidase subunit 2
MTVPAANATDCVNDPKGTDCPCAINPNSAVCQDLKDKAASDTAFNDVMKNIINTLLYIIGIVSVIMIVISGIRWISSRGQPESVSKARQTLTYSVIGLIIAVSAFAIMNFVMDRI